MDWKDKDQVRKYHRDKMRRYRKTSVKLREYMRKFWRSEKRKKYKRELLKNNRAYARRSQDSINEWRRKKFVTDLDFKMKHVLRGRLSAALRSAKAGKKCAPTCELLGCSIKDFRIYIESKFEVGMSWDNHGSVWEIDHIMPCSIFDLTKPEHQKRCFHFSNLQPMLKTKNRSKRDKVETDQFALI